MAQAIASRTASPKAQPAVQTSGYHAQGFALASSFFGVIKAHTQDYARFIRDAWPLSVEARDYALKTLREFVRQARENAKLTQPAAGLDPKHWGRIANTANTRVTQFGTILRAMNAGMNHETLSTIYKVEDVENLSFDSVLEVARGMVQSQGAAGRKADPFLVRLAKWMARQAEEELSDDDKKARKQVLKLIGDMLPDVSKEVDKKKGANVVTQKAAKKIARKARAPKAAVVEEKRVEEKPLPKGVTEDRRAEPHSYH